MTNEEIALVEQLIMTGTATKQAKILGGKAEIQIASLTTGDQLGVEAEMRTIEGTPAFMVHSYSLKLISHVLKVFTFNGKSQTFKDSNEAYAFVLSRPSAVVDAIIGEHTKFEKELAAISKMENLTESFTETPPADSKPS